MHLCCVKDRLHGGELKHRSDWSVALFRMYQSVKLLYSFGIFITFALQFYVPAEILIPPVVARVSDRWETAVDLVLRTVLVIFTCEYVWLHIHRPRVRTFSGYSSSHGDVVLFWLDEIHK